MAMKLNTGKVAFPIEFDNGDKQTIYFNPNDPDLMVRFSNFETNLSSRIEKFKDFELDEEGKPKEMIFLEEYKKMCEAFYEEFDSAFGGEISTTVFKYCSPLAIVNGEYFVIQFIQAILPEIERHVNKAAKSKKEKFDKYLKKYDK